MRLERKYEAEAAHQLSAGVPEGHPCRRLHGHRYEITVTIIGDVNPETGMLLEYAEIDRRVGEVLSFVDHRFINHLGLRQNARGEPEPYTSFEDGGAIDETPHLYKTLCAERLAALVRQNSTVEHLAEWFKAELQHRFPRKNMKVGALSFHEPEVYAVRIQEDSRSAVEV